MAHNIPHIEEEILSFWQKENIFRKSLEKESPKGDYIFYDGPPFATGLPHYGHIVASLMKDVMPRYFTMRGFHVERKWGWDCHGLPIENIVEKELGLDSKKDIEELGVAKFNETCHSKVMLYRDEWKQTIDRLGRWADMENDYKTMDREYMESIWWVFRQLWDKDLVYEDYKSMHICPRCETTLSQSEVAEGYREIKDQSVVAKFELVDEPGTHILAWTTTPWTLPGNVALAVGADIAYVKVKKNGEVRANGRSPVHYAVAKDRVAEVFGEDGYEVVGEMKGSDLVGKKYTPLFGYFSESGVKDAENGWQVYAGEFVNTDEGTGVVHIAPAFGEDDRALGEQHALPFVQHVQLDGRFVEAVTDFAGMEVKPKRNPRETDEKIVALLQDRGQVFAQAQYKHTYPHCWRCDTPLLSYTTSSWFVAVTKFKDEMLKNAAGIEWMPAHMKDGRFGNWLEGARDWSISRQRFWGSVIPLWRCEVDGCDDMIVFGSVEELEKKSGEKVADLHKHIVDEITFGCEKCSGTMRRIPDVLDCWFESGSMPYAQLHYPFENKEFFEDNFPAHFIAEGVDQTRAWFYYLHVLATALRGSAAFKNVIVNGTVLAEDGKKMSKRLQNYPAPDKIFEKYGADAMRYYLATATVMRAEDMRFREREVEEVYKKVLLIVHNVLSFYKLYAVDAVGKGRDHSLQDDAHVLDTWILAKLQQVGSEITKSYENYDINKATRPLAGFVNELSTWYVRRSRDRFKDTEQVAGALSTLRTVLLELSKLMAPVMPFVADYLYREVDGTKESVHLEDWPSLEDGRWKMEDGEKVLEKMDMARKVVELALAERASVKIPVRQPLQKLEVGSWKLEVGEEYFDLIKDEVNVKEVFLGEVEEGGDLSVKLDIEISPELKREGIKRELVRHVNSLRKNMKLSLSDTVSVVVGSTDEDIVAALEEHKDAFLADTISSEVRHDNADQCDEQRAVKVHGVEVVIGIQK